MHEQCQTVVYVLDAECANKQYMYQNERRNRNEERNGTIYMKRDAVVGTVIPRNTPYYLPKDSLR